MSIRGLSCHVVTLYLELKRKLLEDIKIIFSIREWRGNFSVFLSSCDPSTFRAFCIGLIFALFRKKEKLTGRLDQQ